MKVQILGPNDDVPEAVRLPVIVHMDRQDYDDSLIVRLEDGGIWQLPRSAMQEMAPGQYSVAEMFGYQSHLFIFKGRQRSRYARRT